MTSPTPRQSQVGGLLSCPFCGGGATFVKHSAGVMRTQGFDQWDAVACRACGATVGACDRRFRNREDAAKVWNARHAQAAAPQEAEAALRKALGAMLTHFGMDEDEWTKPTFDQARAALEFPAAPANVARDEAFEAVRRVFCKLPRFSFLLDQKGNVCRVPDRVGGWVEFQAAHELFDPVAVDGALGVAPASPSAPTQAAAPGVQGEEEPLGRFNHHPDAGIDFCLEVEAIRDEITDLAAGLPPTMDLPGRIRRAMQFCVGGDADACRAKQQLREIEASLAASPAPGWQPPAPSVEQIASIVRDHLTAVYCCTRVWEAWSVGTMGEDDFVPASETEMPEEVAQAIVAAFASGGDPIRELLAVHQKLIDDGNDYAYFELARTRQTDWMAWITDKPARGEPGTAEYARSRRVIVRGQGDTPEEACRDALAALSAPPLPESQPEGDEPEATICPSCDGTGIEGIDRGEGLMPRCWSCKGSGSLPASPSLPSQEGQHG